MRSLACLVGAALLTSCGGSTGGTTFTYQPSQPATPAELASVGAGQAAVADGAAFHAGPDATTGPSLPGLADAMAAPLFESTALPGGTPLSRALSVTTAAAAVAVLPMDTVAAGVATSWSPGCITTTATSVTYVGCAQASGGVTVTLDGTVSRTASTVDWSLRVTMKGTVASTAGAITLDAGSDLDGTMAFGAGTVKGRSSSVTRATVSGAAIPSVTAAATTAATLDLTYQVSPFCITGGTVELTRVWTARPLGMPTTPPYDDRGYRFTWSGCGQATVAHSR
jgi:hypothetical protein